MKKQRVLYFDMLNIAACVAVVALHQNSTVHSYSDSLKWKTALFVEVVAYWAVPIFLMLTGARLMKYRERYDTPTFFRKRFLRAAIPFLVWSVIYLIWKGFTGEYRLEVVEPATVIDALLFYRMESKFWFFPILFAFYLLMPLLSWLTEKKYRKTLWYAVLVMFVLQSTIPFLFSLMGMQWNRTYSLPVDNYTIFILLGYLLSTEELTPKMRRWIYLGGAAGAVFRYAAIYLLSTADGAKNTIFFNYASFASVMLACAVFIWFRSVDWERVLRAIHVTPERIAYISGCSLGIYLIHYIVMYYELNMLQAHGYTKDSLLWRWGFIPITYLIALGIVSLLKRVPVLRRLVP